MHESDSIMLCTFPDFSQVILDRVVELTPTHTHIIYYAEELKQELWVPHSFVSAQCTSKP